MNRSSSKEVNSSSVLSSSPSHGGGRISIGLNAGAIGSPSATGGTGTNSGSTLMNGNGELMFRRSPVSSQHHHVQQSYYTLGSPSITTSYNSEEISDTINSSLFEDDASVNESLCGKVEQLQRQVDSLSESQASQDERYKRTRQENDELLNRIHLLEDQLRDIEITAEARSREEEKRFKETMAKQMKLKSQECEQHLQTNYQLQQDIITLQKDLIKSESLIRALKSEKEALESELHEKNIDLTCMDEEIHKLKLQVKHLKDEENVKSNLINILNDELEGNQHNRPQNELQNNHIANNSSKSYSTANNHSYNNNHPQSSSPKQRSTSSRRSSLTSGFDDDNSNAMNSKALKDIDVLETNLACLRAENKRLQEMNEELQAQLLNVQLEEGRSLIQEGNKSYSLADEMGDIDVHKLMEALKEQQEDNGRLRRYIDDILLKIVENNPEILDKTTPLNESNSKKADMTS